jgi:arginase
MTTIAVPYFLDRRLDEFEVPFDGDTTVEVDLPAGEPWSRLAALNEAVARAVAGAASPIVMSGDCTTSLGTVAGLQRAGHDPVVVWFDAHGDVQTPETTTSGFLGGMPLRLLVGYRAELIAGALGLRAVPEERVILVDGRDLDPPEVDYLAESAIRQVTVAELSTVDIPEGPIYLHVDLDVVDPTQLPGVHYPAEGGPGLAAVSRAVRSVMDTGRVVGVGLACTWDAGHGAADAVRAHLTAALS